MKLTDSQLEEFSKLTPSEIRERKGKGLALYSPKPIYKPVPPTKQRSEKERALVEMMWMHDPNFNRRKLAREIGRSPTFVYDCVRELRENPELQEARYDRIRKVQEYLAEKVAQRAAQAIDDPDSNISLYQLLEQLTKQTKSLGLDAPSRSLVAHIDGSDMKMPDKKDVAAFTYGQAEGDNG